MISRLLAAQTARPATPVRPVLQGQVDSLSDSFTFPIAGSDALSECLQHVVIRIGAELHRYVLFPDEHRIMPEPGDRIAFRLRDLGHDDYGPAQAIEKDSLKVIALKRFFRIYP